MTRRIFVDTEWLTAPWEQGFELLWIGLADEEGTSWSAIDAAIDLEPHVHGSIVPLIPAEELRLTRTEIGAAVERFCGDVDEFWAWVPTAASVAEWFGLGDEAADLYARFWDVDLQLLRGLIDPWPDGWPSALHNLRVAAERAGVELPPRARDHLNPRVHARWNQQLFEKIRRAGGP